MGAADGINDIRHCPAITGTDPSRCLPGPSP
jgi:hypothetical protein